jgi:SAM-dependent methyltransferase
MTNPSDQGWSEYQTVRIPFSPHRAKAWVHIARHLQRFINESASVLELACGYGDFSNNIRAASRTAMDQNPEFAVHLRDGVRFEVGDSTQLARFASESFDVVFASNFLEHLDRPACLRVCQEVLRVLRPGGTFILLQPNFGLRPRQYFDDYTHVSIFTDVALSDLLTANGFEPVLVKRRFLPLTFKSRGGKLSWLVPLYLRSPIKPLAGQMLVVVRKP